MKARDGTCVPLRSKIGDDKIPLHTFTELGPRSGLMNDSAYFLK